MIKSIVFDWGGVISPAGTPDEVVTSLSELLSVYSLIRFLLQLNQLDILDGMTNLIRSFFPRR